MSSLFVITVAIRNVIDMCYQFSKAQYIVLYSRCIVLQSYILSVSSGAVYSYINTYCYILSRELM